MFELFNLFNTDPYPARWHCGNWTASVGWTHILSDVAIGLAYIGIPSAIIYYAHKLKMLELNYILILFSIFIFSCGTTHIMEAIIFWWPGYNLAAVLKLLTAIVSWATLIAIIILLPESINLLKAKAQAEKLQHDLDKMELRHKGLEEFAHIASHDLQEPLRNIHSLVEMAQNVISNPDELRTYFESILNSSRKMHALIHDLLDFAKISKEQFAFKE
ncbi:MAG TPA: histidine kinase dimerization/phospho-acceptor domain-containing protein, partial [Gammaproteobacteria bacterium]|nr:histidine kinase dimerization/phospho-acceptor domain-containing protein [Gammaproteobacteria bacterium]